MSFTILGHQDSPCSFLGPSSLFQRYNLATRLNYGLLFNTVPSQADPNPKALRTGAVHQQTVTIRVLLIARRGKSADGQTHHIRIYKNEAEIAQMLRSLVIPASSLTPKITSKVTVVDLAEISFEQQVHPDVEYGKIASLALCAWCDIATVFVVLGVILQPYPAN